MPTKLQHLWHKTYGNLLQTIKSKLYLTKSKLDSMKYKLDLSKSKLYFMPGSRFLRGL